MTDFVTRDPSTGNLMLNGNRYRFAGSNVGHMTLSSANNAYGAKVAADGSHLTTHAEIDATLNSAQAMNASVLRAYGAVMNVSTPLSIQPRLGVFNEAAFEPVDYYLAQCPTRGIKIIFPLVGNGSGKFWYCTANGVTPNSAATQFFTNPTVIESFKTHISHVLNHKNQYTGILYKDDPSILAWETGNELQILPAKWTATQQAWTDAIAYHIKVTEGAQQLVADGHSAADLSEEFILDAPHVDMYTHHTYEDRGSPSALVGTAAPIAHAHKKAYFIGEYTWTGKGDKPWYWWIWWPNLSWTLPQMLSAIENSQYVDGDLIWDLLAPLTNWGDGYTLHYPGDTADMRNRATLLKNHAALYR